MSAVSNMENPEKFRILGLPYVAVKEVLSMWNPFELINFSQINPITKMMTTQFTKSKSNRFEIHVLIDAIPTVTIRAEHKSWEYDMTTEKSDDGQYFHEFMYEEIIKKYSEDVVLGFRNWVDYVTEIFNLKIHLLNFHTDKLTDSLCKSYIDWLKTLTDSINCCAVLGKRELDDVVSHLLENLTISTNLSLPVNLTENFRGKIPIVSEYVFIKSSKFVSVDQLLKFESQRIFIENSGLSNQELSRFMTSWMSLESNLNMRIFETTIRTQACLEEILEGLPEEKIIQGIPESQEEWHDVTNDGWQLKRDDDTTAILYTKPFRNHFVLKFSVI